MFGREVYSAGDKLVLVSVECGGWELTSTEVCEGVDPWFWVVC